MGLNVLVQINNENLTVITTYKCSNCGIDIVKTEVKNNEFIEINWENMPHFCVCGEKLLVSIMRFMPILDEIKNIEI